MLGINEMSHIPLKNIYLYNILKTFVRFQENYLGHIISANSCFGHPVCSLKKDSTKCVFLRNCRKMGGSGQQLRTAAFDIIQSFTIEISFSWHSFTM